MQGLESKAFVYLSIKNEATLEYFDRNFYCLG